MQQLQYGARKAGRTPLKKLDLSPPRRRLVECWQDLRYGRIEELVKHNGEPQWSPPPRVFEDVIIGDSPSQRPTRQRGNFAVKDHVADFFARFDRAPEGTKFTIFVQDGLPVRFTMERSKLS